MLYIGARLPALYRTMYNVIISIVMSNLCRFCITAAILDFRALDREKMAPYFFLMFMSYSNRIRRVFAFTKNTRIFVSLQMSLHYQPATTEDNVTMHSTLKTPDWKSRQQYSSSLATAALILVHRPCQTAILLPRFPVWRFQRRMHSNVVFSRRWLVV